MPERARRVIVVGGGFGGLSAAKTLARRPGVEVVLIDRRNHHLFQPLLYQVATAGLNPGDIAVPIRGEFSGAPNVEVHLAEVTGVDLAGRRLQGTTEAGSPFTLPYDSLVLACGSQHSYFGRNDWEPFAPGLKTLEQATEIRRRVLTAFESAENEPDPARQAELLTFVVVGGGPTGVELAGAMAEIAHTVLHRDFRRANIARTRVLLLEAGPRLLAAFDERLSARAHADLRALGVEVRLGERVTVVNEAGVTVGSDRVGARTVVWAAGVSPPALNAALKASDPAVELDRAGRVMVREDLSLATHPEVFVIGDQACVADGPGKTLPGLAPVALQQGRFVGRAILADLRGRARGRFRYVDKGQMATIGKSRAVCQIGEQSGGGGVRFAGLFAWLAWLVVHIFFLIGFRNRISVLAQWAWSYVFSKRGARLITRRDWRLY